MYVNGVSVGTGNLSGVNTPTGNTNLRIGQRVPGGSIPFEGEIDEVRVWNVARTPAEIISTMNYEFCVVPASLQAYYKFNQGIASGTNTSVTSSIDFSANANNGTLTNFALTGTSSNWVAGVSLTTDVHTVGVLNVSGCAPYTTLGNQILYTSGSYPDTVTMASGCDSSYFVIFTAVSPGLSNINPIACDSYIAPSGAVYTSSGIYMDTIPSLLGCDSIITINLTVNNNTQSSISEEACNNYMSPSGKMFTTSGIYMDTIQNSIGCDSVLSIDLTIKLTTSSSISETACLSYTSATGNIYTTSGFYNDTLQNSVGCDSIVLLNLTILNGTLVNQTLTECDSYVSPSGKTWTNSGIYQDTVIGGASCVNIYTIDLTINPSENTIVTESACDVYTSGLGNDYTTSGSYTETSQTINGCDSTITLDLTITNTDSTVALNGITLSANQAGAIYQWYNCEDQTAINGETSASFTATESGSYSVEIKNDNCTVSSGCYEVLNVGIVGLENNVLAVYPSPTNGLTFVELDAEYYNVSVRIFSIDGKMVQSLDYKSSKKIQFDLKQTNGLYTVLINADGKISSFKVLKAE